MTGSEASMRRSRGMSTPAMRATSALRALSLLHLVLGVVTDNQNHTLGADDLASLAGWLDGRSYFHFRSTPFPHGRRAVSCQFLPSPAISGTGAPPGTRPSLSASGVQSVHVSDRTVRAPPGPGLPGESVRHPIASPPPRALPLRSHRLVQPDTWRLGAPQSPSPRTQAA